MMVWLDDERPAPKGWVWVKTAAGANHLLNNEIVTHVSLDHDLGNDKAGTGYDVLEKIESLVYHGKMNIPLIYIHTANPSAAQKMRQAVQKISTMSKNSM